MVAFAILALVGSCLAVTRRVPQDYPTIQAALDEVQDLDTVLVQVGTYVEALIAPARSRFVLRGDVAPDTGNYPRPVVDPSSLPRPDTLSCLTLSLLSHDIVIEDFGFKNGRPMYDSLYTRRPGGLVDSSQNLTVRRCVFDSTIIGICRGYRLTLTDCRFDLNFGTCAIVDSGPITAANCYFSCRGGGGWNVFALSHSTLSHCEFISNCVDLLQTYGDNVIVEDCVFGPCVLCTGFHVLGMTCATGGIIRRNVFTDCQLGVTILNLHEPCPNVDPLPIEISQNTFRNFHGGHGAGGMAISTMCDPGNGSVYMGVIEDNVFEDGESSPLYAAGNALDIWGKTDVRRNRFTRLNPPSVPDVHAYRLEQGPFDTLTLRDNLFDSSGVAATAWPCWIDARWNWWGDSTGPYHPTQNPNGQGGEVGSHVDFIPWYSDTSFLSVDRPRLPLPQSVSLEVYPNPFNASAALKLQVSRPGIFEVSLYNLLGQRVAEIWSGAVAYEKRIAFDGQALSSGLYFVRVYQPIGNRVVALQKIVIAK